MKAVVVKETRLRKVDVPEGVAFNQAAWYAKRFWECGNVQQLTRWGNHLKQRLSSARYSPMNEATVAFLRKLYRERKGELLHPQPWVAAQVH